VSSSLIRRLAASLLVVLGLVMGGSGFGARPAQAQEQLTRKVKSKAVPVYPDVARRMGIEGRVKVVVVVAPNGSIRSTKVVGGHPLLVNAALDALKKWKFESAPEESTGVVEFKFEPQD
jgi:TonB family protein